MKDFMYFMPTRIFYGKDVVLNQKDQFKKLGKKALIVTGKNSSKDNGSLNDVINTLKECNIDYFVFDKSVENPPIEITEQGAKIGIEQKVDFVIGIGGGSSLDSAKGISILIKNPNAKKEDLFSDTMLDSLPMAAIPTTAGTGSEVTQDAVFTDNDAKTKKGFPQEAFYDVAFLDAKYLENTPDDITINTAVDALAHIIEGYLATNANIISDGLAEKALQLFKECKKSLLDRKFSYEIREKLMVVSTIAGMVIAQAGTTLPHGMGYALTYFYKIPHGRATGLLLKEYLRFCKDKDKVNNIISLLGMKDLDEFGEYIKNLLGEEKSIKKEELKEYTEKMMKNTSKLQNHPYSVTSEDIYSMYVNSMYRL